VVLFATPLWYANANDFRTEMTAAIDRGDHALGLVVLDAMGMTDIDYTGARALRQLLNQLDSSGVSFAMARTSNTVRGSLARSGLLALMGEDHLFASVDEAVTALHTDKPQGHRNATGPTGSM
jgi:SulP family sulfate permease